MNNARKFHCDNSMHVYSVPYTSLLPPLYSNFPSSCSPFQAVFDGIHWAVFICVCMYEYIYTYIYTHTYMYVGTYILYIYIYIYI
jgi:hypothetical protein